MTAIKKGPEAVRSTVARMEKRNSGFVQNLDANQPGWFPAGFHR